MFFLGGIILSKQTKTKTTATKTQQEEKLLILPFQIMEGRNILTIRLKMSLKVTRNKITKECWKWGERLKLRRTCGGRAEEAEQQPCGGGSSGHRLLHDVHL